MGRHGSLWADIQPDRLGMHSESFLKPSRTLGTLCLVKLEKTHIKSTKKTCIIGLICDATRLSDVRRNRIQSMHEDRPGDYTDEEKIINELENSKKLFKKYNWPIIDVTRKSVEETAASIIKTLDIINSK